MCMHELQHAQSAPTRKSGGMPPRNILDFRHSEVVSDAIFEEYG